MQLGQRYEKVNPWEDFYRKLLTTIHLLTQSHGI